jgi:hypothetical protein
MRLPQTIIVFIILSLFSSGAFCDEMAARKEIDDNVWFLFMNEKFNELDKVAEKYRKIEERTSSGLWKLTLFYYGFNKFTGTNIKDETYWNDIKSKADKWIKDNPSSPTAHIAKGIILKNYAWKFRGGSWAYKVPKDAWKPFKENLTIAENHMANSKQVASNDPHWYEVYAHIKNGLSEDSESFKKFIDEGLDKTPNYYQLYFAAIDYLAPKWHGNKEEIELFANKAVERTKKDEGMGLYARIYWYASQTQYDERLFSESNVVWDKMRKGIFDVLNKYPDSWNIQNFAFFSCLAKDQGTTRILLEKMDGPIIERAWKKQEYYEYCKNFAYASPNKKIQPTARSGG